MRYLRVELFKPLKRALTIDRVSNLVLDVSKGVLEGPVNLFGLGAFYLLDVLCDESLDFVQVRHCDLLGALFVVPDGQDSVVTTN